MNWDLIKMYILFKTISLFIRGIRVAWFDGRVWVSQAEDVYLGGWIIRVSAFHLSANEYILEDVADSYYPIKNKASLDLLLAYRDIVLPKHHIDYPVYWK